jgi:hypothetical protein
MLAAVLAACATSNPYAVAGSADANATVEGTSHLEHLLPFMESGVIIQSVDGKPLALDESKVVLPPGHHSFAVTCHVKGKLGEVYSGKQAASFDLAAGHAYKFVTEDPSADSKAENNLSLLHVFTNTTAGSAEQGDLAATKDCASFAYDLTYDSHPYPAVVALVPPVDSGDWKEQNSGKRSGYWWRRIYDNDMSEDAPPEYVETEYWSRFAFTEDAHARYQDRLIQARKDCSSAEISVISDMPAGLDYELDMPDCKGEPQVELGRYLGDDHGLHRVAVLIKLAPSATDKAAWLKTLDSASIQTV